MATKSDVKFEPLGDRVVVRPSDMREEKVSAAGIIIPESVEKEAPMTGKVVAVGPGRYNEDGDGRIPMEVKVGQQVMFKKPWDKPVKIDGTEYYVLSESEITLILK